MTSTTIHTFMLGVLVLFGCAANTMSSELAKVTGTLTYPQHTVLPPDAVAYIFLVDVSPRQDSSADIIARQTLKNPGPVPIPFELAYNSSRISTNYLYAIQARITTKDGLHLINTSPYPVITQGNPHAVDVTVSPVN